MQNVNDILVSSNSMDNDIFAPKVNDVVVSHSLIARSHMCAKCKRCVDIPGPNGR